MNDFDSRAREWDKNPVHLKRSEAIAKTLLEMIPVTPDMKALEYGAGTGILSFLLSDKFAGITLMDSSKEMVQVISEKVSGANLEHLKPLVFDLEHSDYKDYVFDCIFLQMVLHHVIDPGRLLRKFYQLLNPNGYIAIADVYSEDGSFHGHEAKVHRGFNPEELAENLRTTGFGNISHKPCYEIKREDKIFPVFLLAAQKV